MYFVYLSLSLSFHRDTIYLFYIYTFFYLITVAVGARTCFSTPLLPIFFFLSSGWTLDKNNTYVYQQHDILSSRHLPLEASYRKITNERKREFLSTLGRMQALLVSYTAYDSVTTISSRNACGYLSLSCATAVSDKHRLLSFQCHFRYLQSTECRRIFTEITSPFSSNFISITFQNLWIIETTNFENNFRRGGKGDACTIENVDLLVRKRSLYWNVVS